MISSNLTLLTVVLSVLHFARICFFGGYRFPCFIKENYKEEDLVGDNYPTICLTVDDARGPSVSTMSSWGTCSWLEFSTSPICPRMRRGMQRTWMLRKLEEYTLILEWALPWRSAICMQRGFYIGS